MEAWDVLVDRSDYARTTIAERTSAAVPDGSARLRVDAFGLTANNVTYAAAGDMIGYWQFFPAPDTDDGTTWGRVPVWGFADVVESHHPDLAVGERLYGYLPMSSDLVIEPSHASAAAISDGSAHRSALPAVYNRYARTATDPGYDPALEAEQMLYRPLFFTSFLIDDFIAEHDAFGAPTVVIASASSKTAFGVAHLLAMRPDITVVGLTSTGNVDFVDGLGCYDHVVSYDDLASGATDLPDGRAMLVDMSGNRAIVGAVHERYGDSLTHSCAVGLTHWQDFGVSEGSELPGPAPEMFFAPSQIERRRQELGAGVLETAMDEAWTGFVEAVGSWIDIEHRTGPAAIAAAWSTLVAGTAAAASAQVFHTAG